MKIVTVNVPESYIDAINKLIGENGLYPSRSELIRCAVRQFLIKELSAANKMAKIGDLSNLDDFDDENFVRVPIESMNEKSEPIQSFKTYKIVKSLNINTQPKETKKNIPKTSKNESNPNDKRNYSRKGENVMGNCHWDKWGLDNSGKQISVSKADPNIIHIHGTGDFQKISNPLLKRLDLTNELTVIEGLGSFQRVIAD